MTTLSNSTCASPAGFLRNSELLLTPLNPDHKQLYLHWNNDYDVRLYFGTSVPYTMRDIDNLMALSSLEAVQFEIWHIADAKPIGMAKISGIHWTRRKCSIGALIGDSAYRHHGYGKQVTRLLVDYIFGELNLNKITAIIYSPNMASRRVVEQLGFRLEARISDAGFFNGEYCEDFYYTMSRKDWQTNRTPETPETQEEKESKK